MAKVAPSAYGTKAKRKTPRELRAEQLKQTCFDALRSCKTTERENGIKKQEQLKNPIYIEMRMDELYPVKKARPLLPSAKENSKEKIV